MLKLEKSFLSSGFLLAKHLHYNICIISVLISAINVQYGACVIPESSQEGPLRSFKSYDDVVMFHYNVPKQVLRATWQFAAYMNNKNCPQRTVNIFLKWGSYPVFSINNASFPSNMYVDQNKLIQTTTITSFESKTTVIVPVYSPVPGDWFVSAYLSHWDEKIHQKGLGLNCLYSLGSVALWSETNGIKNIPLDHTKTMLTNEFISYYKFYISMDVSNFKVDIFGCNFTIKQASNFQGPCIKNIALKGRSLPIYNHSVTVTDESLMPMEFYNVSEFSPFQDEWYYLMVVSSSPIKFNVKVTIDYCPVRTVEEVFIQRYLYAPTYSRASDQLYLKKFKKQSLKWYSINHAFNQSQINDNFVNNKQSNVIDDNTNACVPRYKLVRIKHPQIFMGDYLLQVKEQLTSWLTLTDTYPIITQFDILPLVDIGGTLDINIDLEIDEVHTKQQVNVTICISHGRLPKIYNGNIICDNRDMLMNVSSTYKNSTNLLIPYPQPDTWYIAFKSVCIVNGIPVHCNMEQILVSLNIKLRACAFEGNNPCGEFGTCEKIHKGLLYFSACKCFGGYQGWACTDESNASSKYWIILTTLALTLSNLFFIPAIYLTLKRKFLTEGLVYSLIMIFSLFYHVCDQSSTGYCIARFEVLQYCDFFLGLLAFWVTLVSMADLPVQYVSFCYMLGVIIITFEVESDKTGLNTILITLTIGCFIPLASYGFHCIKIKRFVWPKRPINLIVGLILVTIGLLLFSLVETESNYRYVHSAWHVIIALSLIFLLPVNEDQVQSNKTDNNSVSAVKNV